MTTRIFVAFGSSDQILTDIVLTACREVVRSDTEFQPWNRNDPSGQPIDESVFSWIEHCDALVADISEPNDNVTYEVGLAIGMRKPVRLIRAATKDRKTLVSVGLLHNLGHDDYNSIVTLTGILERKEQQGKWPRAKRNREHPIYFLQLAPPDDTSRRVSSHIKKTIKLKFRNMNPSEIDRLTATEAFEQVSQSFGVIAIWDASKKNHAIRHNQRASYVTGLARGLDVPFLLLAHKDTRLPLDLDEIATRYDRPYGIASAMRLFRDAVYDEQESFVEVGKGSPHFLDEVHCGDPAAENEAGLLDSYFLETEQFRLTTQGDLNILLGRKGSGKTAIFLQARNRTRANKANIVVDLQPEGYQLIRLKSFILQKMSGGARREFIASFWEYIVWLELTYKLLEKDEKFVRYDARLITRFDHLKAAYTRRVEGAGDFTERLEALIDRVIARYEEQIGGNSGELSSSKVLEVVYGAEIGPLREEIMGYLRSKGIVFFLFDNLDRFWTSPSFTAEDALIIAGLVESLSAIRRRFTQAKREFYWAIFLRSDVFEFVVRGMADYGKLSVDSVEWNDPELLGELFKTRILRGIGKDPQHWREIWEAVSVQEVGGVPTLDFLIQSSLMRPRYLIRLFETARRRAITLSKERVDEDDYEAALDELGWQVLEDFDRELVDVVPDVEELMFDLVQVHGRISLEELRGIINGRVQDDDRVETIIDVLIWSGCIGVQRNGRVTYISDCGFQRPYMRALLHDSSAKVVLVHPTLTSVLGRPR